MDLSAHVMYLITYQQYNIMYKSIGKN